jgi:hypothetical protein
LRVSIRSLISKMVALESSSTIRALSKAMIILLKKSRGFSRV